MPLTEMPKSSITGVEFSTPVGTALALQLVLLHDALYHYLPYLGASLCIVEKVI